MSKGHGFIILVRGKRAFSNRVQLNVDPELSRLARQVTCVVTSVFPGSHFTGFVCIWNA